MPLLTLVLILGGDFNVDFMSKSPHNRKLCIIANYAIRNTLTQLISKPTRTTQTSETLIDHIYSNNPDSISTSGTLSYGLSDHDMTYTVLKKNLPSKRKISFTFRNQLNLDGAWLKELLTASDWADFYKAANPDVCWSLLILKFIQCINIVAPTVTVTNVKEKEDWVSPELLCLIRNRDKEKHLADTLKSTEHYNEFKN